MSTIITILIYLFIFLAIYNSNKKKQQRKNASSAQNTIPQSSMNRAAAAAQPVRASNPKQAKPARHHNSPKPVMGAHDESIHDNHFTPLSVSSGSYEGSMQANSFEGRDSEDHNHGGNIPDASPAFTELAQDRSTFTPDLSANGLLNAIVLSQVLGKPGGRMAGNPIPDITE